MIQAKKPGDEQGLAAQLLLDGSPLGAVVVRLQIDLLVAQVPFDDLTVRTTLPRAAAASAVDPLAATAVDPLAATAAMAVLVPGRTAAWMTRLMVIGSVMSDDRSDDGHGTAEG